MSIAARGEEPAVFSGALKSAVSAANIDLDHCRTIRDGKDVPFDPPAVLASLGVGGEARNEWKGGDVGGDSKPATFNYLIALKGRVAVGSLFCEKRDDSSVVDRTVFALRDNAPFPPDPADKQQWEPLNFPAGQSGCRLIAFAPGFTTRLFRIEETRRQGTSTVGTFRLFSTRLFNALPGSNATAPSEYTVRSPLAPAYTYSAQNIVTGAGVWESNGKEDGVVRGAAITPGNPSLVCCSVGSSSVYEWSLA